MAATTETGPDQRVERLHSALRHWQGWLEEYSSYKDAVGEHGSSVGAEEMIQTAVEMEFVHLNEQEARDLVYDKQHARRLEQVQDLLDKRIVYVGRNIKSLEKQIAAACEVKPASEDLGEQSLAVEIIEDLDEQDRLVSGRIVKPSESMDQARDLLEKAQDEKKVTPKLSAGTEDCDGSSVSSSEDEAKPSFDGVGASTRTSSSPSPNAVEPTDIQAWISAANRDLSTAIASEPPGRKAPKRLPEGQQSSKVANTIPTKRVPAERPPTVIAIPSNAGEPPIPQDHSGARGSESTSSSKLFSQDNPREAAIREQMIKYGMQDVGAVVAELELEDDPEQSFDESELDDISGGESFDDEDDEGEDMYGQGKFTAISPRYRQQMEHLQKKLHDASLGREPELPVPLGPSVPEAKKVGERISGIKRKKSVRFAESDETKSFPASSTDPMLDQIVERAPAQAEQTISSPRKVSRFKSSLKPSKTSVAVSPYPLEDVPAINPVRSVLSELAFNDCDESLEPVDPQASIDMSNIAIAHQKSRSKLIHKQGGFLPRDPDEIDEEEAQREEMWRQGALVDENGKRISRFKAARLGRR